MFYTYILKSLQDGKKYIGSTSNLRHRLQLHNAGKVLSTKNRKPFKLIYFETFETMSEVRWRERRCKRSHDLLERVMRKTGAINTMKGGLRPRGPLARREVNYSQS